MADGSVQTAIEEWAITQLIAANTAFKAANPTVKAFDLIGHFRGTEHPSGVKQFLELADVQSPSIQVACWGLDNHKETDAPSDWMITLHVYVVCYMPSTSAAPRIGADDHIGVNRGIEIAADKLDELCPCVANAEADRHAEHCCFLRSEGIGQQGGLYATDVMFEVLVVKK